VAALVGVSPHDVPVLVKAGLVPVLNGSSAAKNSVKWVAASALEPLLHDPRWAERVTARLNRHWAAKNGRRRVVSVSLADSSLQITPAPLSLRRQPRSFDRRTSTRADSPEDGRVV
jgi:hypothetical protein